MFGRLYYPQCENKADIQKILFQNDPYISSETLDQLQNWYNINKDKKLFQDVYFKLGVFEPSRNNWEAILKKLKRVFNYYPSLVKWTINNDLVKSLMKFYPSSGFTKKDKLLKESAILSEQYIKSENMIDWEISNSSSSNFLEAINLGIRHLHLDKSTKHVGSQIMVLSAGKGVYKVWPDIAIPTRRRILENGTMVRIVSLNKPPSHFNNEEHSAVFIYKCFSSYHRRNAYYDPFWTKNDRFDKKLFLFQEKNEDKSQHSRIIIISLTF